MKYHVVHDRHDNPGCYMVARESNTEVLYRDDEADAWVVFPKGTRYPSKRKAEQRAESFDTTPPLHRKGADR